MFHRKRSDGGFGRLSNLSMRRERVAQTFRELLFFFFGRFWRYHDDDDDDIVVVVVAFLLFLLLSVVVASLMISRAIGLIFVFSKTLQFSI